MLSRRENNSSTILISEKLFPYKPEDTQLIKNENIAGILSETGLEVCRLSPKVQTMRHVKNSFNARVTGFCFDPEGNKLAYFLSSKKFLVLDVKNESDITVQIFKEIEDQVVSMNWQELSTEIDYNANPFKIPVYDDDFTPDLTKKLESVK
jgi:hypothetical protein